MNLWGLHAGKHGDTDTLFFGGDWIAIGWPNIPDLSPFIVEPERLKLVIARYYDETKTATSRQPRGQIYRFIIELKVDDIVVFSNSFSDKRLHFARVIGKYVYSQEIEPMYPHRRKVKWVLLSVPRSEFSKSALQLGVDRPQSFFQIKDGAAREEYMSKIRHLL
jgi:predicted Mrr-cat superfamily restriction endonuclease